MEHMTIKQLAEYLEVNDRTLKRKIKKIMPNKMKRGVLTKLDKSEVDKIMKEDKRDVLTVPSETSMTDVLSSIKMLADTVNYSLQGFDARIKNIENKFEERKALLPAPEKTDRMNLVEIVRRHAEEKKMYHSVVFSIVYKDKEASYRLNKNFKLMAERNGQSIIDYVDETGYMPEVLSIAIEILGG
jgi:hypothetical protein